MYYATWKRLFIDTRMYILYHIEWQCIGLVSEVFLKPLYYTADKTHYIWSYDNYSLVHTVVQLERRYQ